MNSSGAVLLGNQEPTYLLSPAEWSPAGQLTIELAASAGLILDPWQERVLHGALAEEPDPRRPGLNRWVCSEAGVIVPRQDGKGAIIEARELAGLFLFEEELIIHSAHEVKTSKGAFRRLRRYIQNTPDLASRVKQYRYSNEEISIELWTEQKLQYLARSSGSGRGFTGSCLILDEAFNLSAAMMSALIYTLAAMPNTQTWYLSSAPLPGAESDTLRRLCARGRAGAREAMAA